MEEVVLPTFVPTTFGCMICGNMEVVSINSLVEDAELLNFWRGNWATSLCKILGVADGYEELFLEAKFCSRCQEMVCKSEATFNLLSKLHDQLNQLERSIQQLFRMNYSIKTENFDAPEEEMASILQRIRFDLLAGNRSVPAVDPLGDIDSECGTPLAESFTTSNVPRSEERLSISSVTPSEGSTRISRLMELKQRQQLQRLSPYEIPRRGRPRKTLFLERLVEFNHQVQSKNTEAYPTDKTKEGDAVNQEHDGDFGLLGPNQFQNLFANFVQGDGQEEKTNENSSNRPSKPTPSAAYIARQTVPNWTVPSQRFKYICNYPDCFKKNLSWPRPTLVRTHCVNEHPGEGLETTPYHCSNCQGRFSTNDEFQNHKSEAHPELELCGYGCPFCNRKFVKGLQLSAHLRHCIGKKSNENTESETNLPKKKIPPCFLCSKSFHSDEEAIDHSTLHENGIPKSCVVCPTDNPKVFRTKTELKNHVSFYHNCEMPQNVPTSESQVAEQNVANTNTQKKRFRSSRRTSRKAKRSRILNIQKAIQIRRENPEHYSTSYIFCNFPKCRIENLVFATRLMLRSHLRTEHGYSVEESKCTYSCDRCVLRFQCLSELEEHWRLAEFDPRHRSAPPENLQTNDLVFSPPSTKSKTNKTDLLLTPPSKKKRTHKTDLLFTPPSKKKRTNKTELRLTPTSIKNKRTKKSDEQKASTSVSKKYLKQKQKRRQIVQPREEGGSFLCCECGLTFKYNSRLRNHISSVHVSRQSELTKCKYCMKSFRGSSEARAVGIQQHELLHSESELLRPFGCVLCERNLRSTVELKEHVRISHEEYPWKCDVENCGKAFEYGTQLISHKAHHHHYFENRVYKCNQCDFSAKDSKGLRIHTIYKHGRSSAEITYPCTVEGCTAVFKLMRRRTLHLTGVHGIGIVKIHRCKICGMEFRRGATLTKHEQCHSDERPFICEICSAAFKCRNNLNQHYKVHDPQKKTGNNWKLQQPRKPRVKASVEEQLAHTEFQKAKAGKKSATHADANRSEETSNVPPSTEITTLGGNESSETRNRNEAAEVPQNGHLVDMERHESQGGSSAQRRRLGMPPVAVPSISLLEPISASVPGFPYFGLGRPNVAEMSTVDPRIWQHFANYRNSPF